MEVINKFEPSFLESIITSLSFYNANFVFNNFSNVIISKFDYFEPSKLKTYSEFLTYYDFSDYDKFVDATIKKIITASNEAYNELFDHLIKTFDENDIDKAINYMYQYSVSFNEHSDFLFAKKYIDMSLSYQQDNLKLLKYKILISIGCKSENSLHEDIFKLSDFTTLERLLVSYFDKDDMIHELQNLSGSCSKYVSISYKKINNKIFDVFDRLIRYFPEDAIDELIDALENMANACISYGLFDMAEKYYSMITGLDSSEYKAYWGLLQAKLKCKNNKELIRQNIVISDLPEFNNALFLATKNSTVYEEYIDCKAKQTEYLKRLDWKKRLRKKIIFRGSIFTSLFVLISLISTLTIFVFIPNVKYDEAISLVNQGKYNEAYKKFDDLKYKDYENQMLVCKAGNAFSNGDYENGIKNIYDAGGVINVFYNSKGGELDKTNEIITKKSKFINNLPLLVGYDFYGWVIHDFDINTSHKNYECTLELNATYKLVNYTLTYELNGAEVPNLPKTYNYESDDILLPNPVKKGYEFIGWESAYFESPVKDLVIKKGSHGNKHFVANFKAKEYNITYDYGYDGKSVEEVVTYDTYVELNTPSRDGYQFEGWTNKGEKIENGKWGFDYNVTLKAKWSLIKYEINYELNGGNNDISNLNHYTIETPTFELSQPTKPGYDFIGWTGTDLNEPTLDVLIRNGSIGNRNYIANWEPHSYKITFDSMGGELNIDNMDVAYNADFVLPKPVKTGYTFSGWYNLKDDSLVVDGKRNYLFDLNLYAKRNTNSYNIFYKLDGGINHKDNPSSFTFESEDITIQNPIKDGYTFIGWNSELGIEQIQPIVRKGTNTNLTFKANWKPNLNTFIFNGNGNTSGEMPSVSKFTDETFVLPKNQFVRLGYHFIGWSYLSTGNPQLQDGEEIKTTSTPVVNLYAVWEANVNMITYHGNGSDNGTMANQSIKTDDKVNLNFNQFSKKGYHFVGWSSTPNGEIEYKENDLYLMGANSNYDLYAIWEPNEYEIRFDNNGGENNSEFEIVTYDKEFVLPIPNRKGYLFSGWYLDSSQITDASGLSLLNYTIPGNITVSAHWTPKINTVILKNLNEEKILQGNSDTLIRLPKDIFQKDKHSLVGWAEYDGGPVKYYNDDLFYIGTTNEYELYAIWEEVTENKFEGYNKISTKEDFLSLIEIGGNSKYYLTNDIDLEGATIIPTVDFYGEIDGNGFSIRNFNLSLSDYEEEKRDVYWHTREITYNYYAGFFKTTMHSTIKNLQLDSFRFNLDFGSIKPPEMDRNTSQYIDKYSKLYIGAFSGCGHGDFENCKVITQTQEFNLTTSGAYYIGLFSGYDDAQLTFSNYVNCFSYNNLSFNGELKSVRLQGGVTTNTFHFGGIVGYIKENKLKNCAVVNNEVFNVVTKDETDGYYKPNNKTYIGDYSGNKINHVNCSKFDALGDYTNYVCFNFNDINSHQFVKGHTRFNLNKNMYVKDGHNFIGWSLTPNGEVVYKDMDECFIPYGENKITLYPVFVKN